MSLRIAYVTAAGIPSVAANSVQVMRMCQAFARQGAAVDLLCRPGFDVDDVFSYYGVDRCFGFRAIGPAVGGVAGSGIAMLAAGTVLLGGLRPHLVYARTPFPLIPAAGLGARVALELHAPASTARRRAAERLVFRADPLVVTITHALRRYYVERGAPEDVLVAPDGADPHPVSAWSSPSGPFTVGFVGSFYAGRGVPLVLEVARRCPEVRFELIGGTDADLEGSSPSALPSNVAFLGRVRPSEVHARLARYDALLAPYQDRVAVRGGGDTARWCSPIKIFEYMAAGRAIVASDLPVLREVLEHERNALLLPPADPVAWATAIRALQNDPSRTRRLASEARRDLEQEYSWDVRARRILDFVRDRRTASRAS